MREGVPPVRRIALVLMAAAATLAGCGNNKIPPIGAAPAEKAPAITAASMAGPPTFVGRWASSKAACAKRAWVFGAGGLQSPGALSCQFAHIDAASAGYTVSSLCSVGKAQSPTRLVITLTGKGATRSLTISSGPFTEPVPLAWCGDVVAEAVPASAASPGQG